MFLKLWQQVYLWVSRSPPDSAMDSSEAILASLKRVFYSCLCRTQVIWLIMKEECRSLEVKSKIRHGYFEKFNWKHFLPVSTRESPDKPSFSFLKIKDVEKYCSVRWKTTPRVRKIQYFPKNLLKIHLPVWGWFQIYRRRNMLNRNNKVWLINI